ncbi:MAG: XRE family transcriptional regulator [Bacteroidales bacterium]|nr:XRE family transcriptional regulator [Bacteroidales bacterium]MBQ7819529.1 XRE family transcriptional regulator [Bacteroidales bacterium]
MIHIGKIIEEEFYRQGRSVSWFAKMLCCERTNVYKIFKRESIDSALLFKISQILNHNFFSYYTKIL